MGFISGIVNQCTFFSFFFFFKFYVYFIFWLHWVFVAAGQSSYGDSVFNGDTISV